MTARRPWRACCSLAAGIGLATIAVPVAGAGSVALSAGYAEQTTILGITAAWDAASPLAERDTWRITAHVEFDVMELRGRRSNVGGYQSLASIGATPVARFERPNDAYIPFVDIGVGVNLLSHTELQEEQQFSTAFQFGELIGAGLRFGSGGAYEIGVRLQHMSNADIKLPNDGITAAVAQVAYHF